MGDNRASIYYDDQTDRLIFRASSLSRCDVALIHSAFDSPRAPTPDFMQRAFDEGHAGEDEVLRKFCEGVDWNGVSKRRHAGTWMDCEAARWKLLDPKDAKSYHDGKGNSFLHCTLSMLDDDQFTVEIPCGGNRVVRGHMDGVAELYQRIVQANQPDDIHASTMGKRVIVEAKLFGPDYYKKWLSKGIAGFDDYAMQISEYGYATGLDVVFVVGQKKRKTDADGEYAGFDVGEVDITYIKNEDLPVPIGVIKARVFKLGRMYEGIRDSGGGLPDCVGSTFPDFPCDYYQTAHVDAGEQGGFNSGGDEAKRIIANMATMAGTPVELVKGKEEVAPIQITDRSDQIRLDTYGKQYLDHTKEENALKKKKVKLKELTEDILNKYRAKDDEGNVIPGGVFESDGVVVEWDYKFTPGGVASVTKDRTVNTPKFKMKGE